MFDEIQLAQKLIQCPSITPNDDECQNHTAQWLSALGFEIKLIPSGPVKNLWATHGTGEPLLVLAGHTDVVPPGHIDNWCSPPFAANIKNGHLIGRGAVDMKGAIACMVSAAYQFLSQYTEHKGTLAFLITSAEEGEHFQQGTPVILDYLKAQQIPIQWCILGEPTSQSIIGDTIKIGRRGSLHGTLRVIGKQGHIAYPHLANNPIHAIADVITALSQLKWDDEDEFFQNTELQISHIQAGDGSRNVIAHECLCFFNIRFGNTKEKQIQQQITTLINRLCENYVLDWKLSGQAFITKPGRLLKAAQDSIQQTQQIAPTLSTSGGTSDGRFIASHSKEILELGLRHKTAHQVNEFCTLEELKQLTNIYLSMLQKLLA